MWGFYIMSNFKNYGQEFNYDDRYLSLVVGNLASFGNGGFRLFAGISVDYLGFRTSFNINLMINIFLASTINLIGKYSVCYAIWIFLAAIGEGSCFVQITTLVYETFGAENGAKVLSKTNIAHFLANFT